LKLSTSYPLSALIDGVSIISPTKLPSQALLPVGKFDRGISEARSVRGDRALIVAGTGHNGKYSGGSEPPIKIHRRGCIGADGSIKGDLAIPQSGFRISVTCNST
jgi:hypothetical protein